MLENTGSNLEVAPTFHVKADFRKNLRRAAPWFCYGVGYLLLVSALLSRIETGWSYFHALYFTVINATTVGFGDVIPITSLGKVIAALTALVGLGLFGIIVAIITLSWQPSGGSVTSTSSSLAYAPKLPRGSTDNRVEDDVADFLEDLATFVRATNRPDAVTARASKSRSEIYGNRHNSRNIHLIVDVRTDKSRKFGRPREGRSITRILNFKLPENP